jgi:hypothetical protein
MIFLNSSFQIRWRSGKTGGGGIGKYGDMMNVDLDALMKMNKDIKIIENKNENELDKIQMK